MEKRTCNVEGCGRGHNAYGYCKTHYMRWKRNGSAQSTKPTRIKDTECLTDGCDSLREGPGLCKRCHRRSKRQQRSGRQCSVAGCDRTHEAQGLCKSHYRQWRVSTGQAQWREGRAETCSGCGKQFQSKRPPGQDRYYCTTRCYHEQRRQPQSSAIRVVDCLACGVTFTAHGPGMASKKYCSKTCGRQARPSGYVPRPPRRVQCEVCRGWFQARQGVPRYCSPQCHRRSDAYKAQRDRHRDRRRAQQYASEYQAIDRGEVFDRDGWRCGICGKRVGKSYAWPHPRSASLDHIVALARGGSHTYDNVQLAHLGCNISKSADGAGQLRLMG